MQSTVRQCLSRAVARMPSAARSMAGGGSTGGKTPTYKRMRGVVCAQHPPNNPKSPPPIVLVSCDCAHEAQWPLR